MGGESTGNFSTEDGIGVLKGEVVDVPFLNAPGFILARATASFPDVSDCTGLTLRVKSTSKYAGFRVSFGNAHPKQSTYRHAFGHKAPFSDPSNGFHNVVIPFTAFSDYWDDATGDIIVKCEDEPKYCPKKSDLQAMKTISLWAEGVAGVVDLQIQSIKAHGCPRGEVRDSAGSEITQPTSGEYLIGSTSDAMRQYRAKMVTSILFALILQSTQHIIGGST